MRTNYDDDECKNEVGYSDQGTLDKCEPDTLEMDTLDSDPYSQLRVLRSYDLNAAGITPSKAPTTQTQTTATPNAINTLPLTTASRSTSSKACFAGSETVRLATLEVRPISDVRVGDQVLAADAAGITFY